VVVWAVDADPQCRTLSSCTVHSSCSSRRLYRTPRPHSIWRTRASWSAIAPMLPAFRRAARQRSAKAKELASAWKPPGAPDVDPIVGFLPGVQHGVCRFDLRVSRIAWCNLWDRVARETGLSEEALMQLMKEGFLLRMEQKRQWLSGPYPLPFWIIEKLRHSLSDVLGRVHREFSECGSRRRCSGHPVKKIMLGVIGDLIVHRLDHFRSFIAVEMAIADQPRTDSSMCY
jgi:hypothetical protein